MKRLPAALLKSLTHDRGSEMAWHPDLAPGPGTRTWHPDLARRLKIDIRFRDPPAPPPAPLPADFYAIACRAMPGKEAATRTPTACCVSSCPGELT